MHMQRVRPCVPAGAEDQTFVFARRAAIIPQSVVVMVTLSIDEGTLREIVRRLVEATDPDRIVYRLRLPNGRVYPIT
jgi:hypothetical protein